MRRPPIGLNVRPDVTWTVDIDDCDKRPPKRPNAIAAKTCSQHASRSGPGSGPLAAIRKIGRKRHVLPCVVFDPKVRELLICKLDRIGTEQDWCAGGLSLFTSAMTAAPSFAGSPSWWPLI
jgi:hypothetical protein